MFYEQKNKNNPGEKSCSEILLDFREQKQMHVSFCFILFWKVNNPHMDWVFNEFQIVRSGIDFLHFRFAFIEKIQTVYIVSGQGIAILFKDLDMQRICERGPWFK